MDFFEVVRHRRSIRKFAPREIPAELMEQIYEAIRLAPSAGNLQAYAVLVVEDQATLHKLAEAALGQEFIKQAPIALVFCADPARAAGRYGARGEQLYALQDATIACAHAHLAAAALGLGSVWVGAFRDHEVWEAIGSPKGLKPVAILPIGYPAEHPGPTSRRSLKELIRRAN